MARGQRRLPNRIVDGTVATVDSFEEGVGIPRDSKHCESRLKGCDRKFPYYWLESSPLMHLIHDRVPENIRLLAEPQHGRQSHREEDQAAKRIDESKREARTKGGRDDEKKKGDLRTRVLIRHS